MDNLDGAYVSRNKALVVAGLKTALRVSELLAWKEGDVLDLSTGRFKPRIYLARKNLKGRKSGRSIPFNRAAAFCIGRWLVELRRRGVPLHHDLPLFLSRQGTDFRAIDRSTAFRIMQTAARKAGLPDGVGTHTLRKTAAKRAYAASGHDLLAVMKFLAHRQITTTVTYLSWELEEKSDRLIMGL